MRVDLVHVALRPLHDHSVGMRRRLDIAASMITRPETLCLEDPRTGLAPAPNNVSAIVLRLARAGTTVFLTTQQLGESHQLGDRIAVIDHERVVRRVLATGARDPLKSGAPDHQRRRNSAALRRDVIGAS